MSSEAVEIHRTEAPKEWSALALVLMKLGVASVDREFIYEKVSTYITAERMRKASVEEQLRKAQADIYEPLIQPVDVAGVRSNAPVNLPIVANDSSGPSIPPIPVGKPRKRTLPAPPAFLTQITGEQGKDIAIAINPVTGATELEQAERV